MCDLAGTEPAGDIVYASYSKKKFPDGTVEYKYEGPHKDQTKTKNLQNQGKKINLSLSEMAQFFMKMANAIKAKKLKPGVQLTKFFFSLCHIVLLISCLSCRVF